MTPRKYEKGLFNLQKYPKILVFQVIIDKVTYTLVRKLYKRSCDVAYDMIFMTMPEARTVRTVSMLLKTDQNEFNIPKVP